MSKNEKSKMTNEQLAATLGLQPIDTEQAKRYISLDILRAAYGRTAKLDKRIEEVYENWTGSKWEKDNDKIMSMMLVGPPGQGKTTAFKKAGEEVAAALNLRFVLNPADDYGVDQEQKALLLETEKDLKEAQNAGASPAELAPIAKRIRSIQKKVHLDLSGDFVFVSQEFSAENSKMELGGIPSKQEEAGMEYMTKLVNKRLAVLGRCGAGILLLDDFPNASPNIQNLGLSITDEKRFQGLNLAGTYIGLTGNLGSHDGTNTSRMSTALRGRCEVYFTADKLDNFVNRMMSRFRDEIGDAGVLGFLQRYEQHFSSLPDIKQMGGFPSPRTWDDFTLQLRRSIRDHGGRGKGELKALKDIAAKANAKLGLEVGQAFYAYYHALMRSADPLARSAIIDGELKKDQLAKRYKEGFSSDEQHFANQFALAVGDYTVSKIVKEGGKLDEAIERFTTALVAMNNDVWAFALNHMKTKLAIQQESLSQKYGDTGRELTSSVKEQIGKIIMKNKDIDSSQREVMIDALSNADKVSVNRASRNRR